MSAVVAGKWTEESDALADDPPFDSSPRTSSPTAKPNSKGSNVAPCALAYLDGGSVTTTPSKKMLPAIRSKYENREIMLSDTPRQQGGMMHRDFIPIDILNSLTQIPSPPSKEQLGPPTKFKKVPTVEKPSIRKRPANVWNFNKGRDKLKHLVNNPPCLCGAGRDISFLYDALLDTKKDKGTAASSIVKRDGLESAKTDNVSEQGKSTVVDNTLIPCTLVPDEYHLVKNPGVVGLEFTDDKHTTHLKEHEDHLTIFPSMKPTGRQEVLKLKHAFETLLTRAGVEDESKELSGPTQVHNLLEIVKKEQSIYNIVFNELIRQCTVECVERGELLASLRAKYAQLLDRIPRQVMSLHQEVLAQRALDRRLTEELVRFKASVSVLTNELAVVKAHDHEVTKQAMLVQQELNTALWESEKNANLLEEYHELYELQRKRLEAFVKTLSEERDLWGSASYILALKVTDHHKLNVAKRLHLHERAWSKLARHFSLGLSQKDSEQLHDVMTSFQLWKDLAEKLNSFLQEQENICRNGLQRVLEQLQRWRREFERVVSPEMARVQAPDMELIEELLNDMKSWEELCNNEGERFAGGNLLSCNDKLYHLYNRVEEWTDVALKVFRRHEASFQNDKYNSEMSKINQQVERLHQQFQIRANGENGVAKRLIDLSNPMETWGNKLTAVIKGAEEMLDPEWIRLADQVGNQWLEITTEILALIGSSKKEDDDQTKNVDEARDVTFDELCQSAKTWLNNMTNAIESEDGKLMQIVNDLHSTVLRWMITVLLRLAPDVEDTDLGEITTDDDLKGSLGGGDILMESTSQEIISRAARIASELRKYSMIIKKCCSSFVMETMLEKKDRYEDDAEVEYNDLKRLAKECEGWIRTSDLLVKQVLGELPIVGIELELNDSSAVESELVVEGIDKERKRSLDSEGTTNTSTRSTPLNSTEVENKDRSGSLGQEGVVGSPRELNSGASVVKELPVAVTPEDNDKVNERQETDQVAEEATGADHDKMRVLAEDDTVRTKSLGNEENKETTATPDHVTAITADVSPSFEVIATVEKLQNELLAAEERAQLAEQRALNAESELKLVLEKLRSLERLTSRPASGQSPEASAKVSTSGKSTPSTKRRSSRDSSVSSTKK